MPFSNELGMRVFDPREGEQYGLQVGQMFAQAMQHAQDRSLRERELKMQEEEHRTKASMIQQRQLGMKEMADLIADYTGAGVPDETAFKWAFFDTAPKLFPDNPEALYNINKLQESEKLARDKFELDTKLRESQINLNKAKEAYEKSRGSGGQSKAMLDALEEANLEYQIASKQKASADQASTVLQPGGPQPILQPRQAPSVAPPEAQPDWMPPAQTTPMMPQRGENVAPGATPPPGMEGAANPLYPGNALNAYPLPVQEKALEILRAKREGRDTSQQKEREDYAKLIEDKSVLDALVKDNPTRSDLKQRLRETNAKLTLMSSQHKAPMTGKLEINPDGTVSMSFGEGAATVGTQTATQGELANIKNSIVQIDQAAQVLTEKDLGVAGNVWDRLVNRWATQLIPGAGDPSVSSNRAQLQKAVDSYLQSQQSRGRLSAREREEVRDSLVTQNLGESLPRAQDILHTMSRIQKFEAIARAKTGQQPLQAWMFNNLSQEEIRQLLREQVITEPEFFEWASKAPMRRWVPPSQTAPQRTEPPPYRSPSSVAPPGTVG